MRSCLLALALLLLPASALAGLKETIAAIAPSATVLVVDSKGDELIAQNAEAPFVPASVTKIASMLAKATENTPAPLPAGSPAHAH